MLLLVLLPGGMGFAFATSGTPSAFEVRRYDVVGNTLLGSGELDGVFTNATGSAVSLNLVFKALADLHRAYQERGFVGVNVTLPRQAITNGVVRINVNEGGFTRRGQTNDAPAPAGSTTSPALEVRRYEITGNTVLPSSIIEPLLAKAIGKNITLDQLRKAAGELQLAYRERGFVTASVNLPPQRVTNATVRVNIIEGTLAAIRVTENRYFSSNNVMRALPSLRTNILLNGHVFQRELDVANANRDRLIYPTISPGPDPGTSALELRVKDRFPLHGHVDIDNHSTPGTPELRVNAAAQYNNLWQLEHQLGVTYGFSPEEFKSGMGVSDRLFNRPLIAYYGAFYRLPLGAVRSVEEELSRSPNFGYDEATRQFRPPPATSRSDFTVYANASSSDTGVKLGPLNPLSGAAQESILSRDSGQNITLNEVLGGRLSVPFTVGERARVTLSAGADFKRYALTSYNTNNFYITTVITNTGGSQTIQSFSPVPQTTRHDGVPYLPLTAGIDLSETDELGNTSASLVGSVSFIGVSPDFAQAAYSSKAGALFGKVDFALSREFRSRREWSLLVRAGAQASPNALISNEQFALGGFNSVRGYHEGETYGDSGWFGGIEGRTPFLRTSIASFNGSVPVALRAFGFMDFGQRFLSESGPSLQPAESLWSAGFGWSANIDNRFDLHVALGWPLTTTPFSRAGEPRTQFSLGGQF